MMKNIKTIIIIFFLSLSIIYCNKQENKLYNELNHIFKLDNNKASYFIFLITNIDCSECAINNINRWITYINEDNNNGKIYFLLYDFEYTNEEKDIRETITSNISKSDYLIKTTKNFDIIKMISLSSKSPYGPYIIKIKNKNIEYILNIMENSYK